MKITAGTDGVKEVTFHQSFLNDYHMCPARAIWNIERFPNGTPPSTATAIGTAMHAGIEAFYHGADPAHSIREAWEQEEAIPGFVKDPKIDRVKALTIASNCYRAWVRDIEPRVGEPTDIELKFRVLVEEAHGVRLYLGGTIDAVCDGIIWDWKTAASMYKYQQWEVDRWFFQPTVYTYALALLDGNENPRLFNYGIVEKRKSPVGHTMMTVRSRKNWDFLRDQMWSIYHNVSGTEVQPLNDQGWWCSPKWCAHYDLCKGAH